MAFSHHRPNEERSIACNLLSALNLRRPSLSLRFGVLDQQIPPLDNRFNLKLGLIFSCFLKACSTVKFAFRKDSHRVDAIVCCYRRATTEVPGVRCSSWVKFCRNNYLVRILDSNPLLGWLSIANGDNLGGKFSANSITAHFYGYIR